MTRNSNVTTACAACKGRGWFDKYKHYFHTTIESLMPHGDYAYMCASCHGSGQRSSTRRRAMTFRFGLHKGHRLHMNRNNIWRIYRTSSARADALHAIRSAFGKPLHYITDWHDANGYGLHVVREQEIRTGKKSE